MIPFLTQLEPFVHRYGLPGLFVDVLAESMGLPFPGETLMILASGLAALGQLNIYAVAATVFTAAVIGDNIGFFIGRTFGRPLVVRHGSRFGITHERLAKVEAILQKHGALVVAGARFVVLLRQLNGIAAGTAGMHWLTFLVANAVGAALWTAFWTTLAYRFGKDVSVLPYFWRHLSWTALIFMTLIALALVGGTFWYWRKRR